MTKTTNMLVELMKMYIKKSILECLSGDKKPLCKLNLTTATLKHTEHRTRSTHPGVHYDYNC